MSEHLTLPYNAHLTQILREKSTSSLQRISMRSTNAVSHSLASTWIAEKLKLQPSVCIVCL